MDVHSILLTNIAGIRVNAISPGYMDTALNRQEGLEAQKKIWREHTPQKRLGSPDELNGLAIYLASDASSFMTGASCIIDGGTSPAVMFMSAMLTISPGYTLW